MNKPFIEDTNVDKNIFDIDYVISDLHFDHKNIIKYCREDQFDYTQSGVDTMNQELLANWNETVSSDETVLVLGDFLWFKNDENESQKKITDFTSGLNGEKVFLRGDHDHIKPVSTEEWNYSAIVHHRGRRYLATHFPGDTPGFFPGDEMPSEFKRRLPSEFASQWDGWRLHGHHHNNWLDTYPLINPHSKTVNCSVELIGYRPLAMDQIHELVEAQKYVEKIGDILP